MDEECVERVKESIDFDAWCGRNTLNASLFIHKYFIAASCIKNWQLHRLVPIDVAGMPRCIQSMWRSPGGDPEALLRYDVYECDSHMAAHELLVHVFGEFQSAEVYRRDDVSVGDVLFIPEAGQALIFIRANLLVFLANAGRTHASLAEIARDLDENLIAKPDDSDLETASHVLRLSVMDLTLTKHTVAPLRLELELPEDKPFYYKFFCSAGEVLIEQDRLSYRAADVGESEIDAYVTGESGYFAYRQLRLTVTP